jgi:hypothetical protein
MLRRGLRWWCVNSKQFIRMWMVYGSWPNGMTIVESYFLLARERDSCLGQPSGHSIQMDRTLRRHTLAQVYLQRPRPC